MERHRDIAASPARTVGATWDAITDLVVETLGRSPTIDGLVVREAFGSIAPGGQALVAAGHLDKLRITVVADPLRLTIGTVSGAAAFRALEDETVGPVPGAATAEAWTAYLPRPSGLARLLDEVVEGIDHVSTAAPPAEAAEARTSSALSLDLRRLDPINRSRR